MRIALAQMSAGPDPEENLQAMTNMVEAAARSTATLVVFPEGAMVHLPDVTAPLAPLAQPLDGPFVSALRHLARRFQIAVVCGMYEPAGDGRAYNTVVAIDPAGEQLGCYRKIHLFDAFGHRESDRIRPGPGETLVFHLGEFCLGVMTCYDLRFPELARQLVDRGAEVLVIPSGWVHGRLKEQHWEILVRARAIENTCYVLAADQTGSIYSGSSMVVDPMGVVRARAGETEEVLVADLLRERIGEVRQTLPSLRHRRLRVVPLQPAAT